MNSCHFIAGHRVDLSHNKGVVSDLTEAEPVVVLLAQFLLQSNDQLFHLFSPGLCDQTL